MEHVVTVRIDHGLYCEIEKHRKAINKSGHFEIGLSEFVRGMVRAGIAQHARAFAEGAVSK